MVELVAVEEATVLQPPSNMGKGASIFRSWLRSLPDQIAEAELERRPIIIEWPTSRELPWASQRLYATLGVYVRFKDG